MSEYVDYAEYYDYDHDTKIDLKNQIQHSEIRFEEFDQAGTLVRKRTLPLDTRYTFRYELQLLLEKTGFEVLEVYRDFEKNPYDGTGEFITVAQRGRRRPRRLDLKKD